MKLHVPREESFPIPMKKSKLQEQHMPLDVIWEKTLKITGTWMEEENCLMHGQSSHDSS